MYAFMPLRPAPSKLRRSNLKMQLYLGVPSTLIPHEIGAFRKRSSNRRNLKPPAFHFRVDGKHLDNGPFRKRWHHDNHLISLTKFFPVFLKHKTKLTADCCVLKFLQRRVDGPWKASLWTNARVLLLAVLCHVKKKNSELKRKYKKETSLLKF